MNERTRDPFVPGGARLLLGCSDTLPAVGRPWHPWDQVHPASPKRPHRSWCSVDPQLAFVDLTQRWRASRVVPTLQVGRRGADVGGRAGSSVSPLPGLGRAVSGQGPVCDPLGLSSRSLRHDWVQAHVWRVRWGVLQAPWLQGTGIEAPGGPLNLQAALPLAPGALLSRPVPPTRTSSLPRPTERSGPRLGWTPGVRQAQKQ